VTIILLFFYLDALVMLIGAEINSEVDGAMRLIGPDSECPPPSPQAADVEEAAAATPAQPPAAT